MSILTVGSYKVIIGSEDCKNYCLGIYQRSRLSKLISTGNACKNDKIAIEKSKVSEDL